MGCVYEITNQVDNKSYIGMTEKTIWERVSDHIVMSQVHKPKSDLAVDIRKWRMENFSVEILFESDLDWELRKQERILIRQRKTYYPFGYNKTNYKDYSMSGRGWHDDNRNEIVNELTGEVYASVSEAARELEVDKQTVERYLDSDFSVERRRLHFQIRRVNT